MATSSSSADDIAYRSPSLPSSTSSSVRPGVLNLTEPTSDREIPAVPSVLSLTNGAKNLDQISYPEGILSSQQLHRYTQDFMLQFIDIHRDSPKGIPNCIGIESSTSLPVSENRWERNTICRDLDKGTLIIRKITALLNKLTMEKFEKISDQIVRRVSDCEGETDGTTLTKVIGLVYDKATQDEMWVETYARLCKKMMEGLQSSVRNDGIKSPDGEPFSGGRLFRKYLLNRCQDDFERRWLNKVAVTQDTAPMAVLDPDGDYTRHKVKQSGLGLIRFIGELFKLQMLTERIIHQCFQKLLGGFVDCPREDDLESCCKLMMVVGPMIDTPRARNHMMIYFSRLAELRNSTLVSSRIQCLLQDVLDLRENKWVGRHVTTIDTPPENLPSVHAGAGWVTIVRREFERELDLTRLTLVQRVVLAQQYGVFELLLAAYVELATRPEPLSDEEAAAVGCMTTVRIWRARENYYLRSRVEVDFSIQEAVELEFKEQLDSATRASAIQRVHISRNENVMEWLETALVEVARDCQLSDDNVWALGTETKLKLLRVREAVSSVTGSTV